MDLPYLTHDLPGIGGVLRTTDDDFFVDEEPAYAASGTGDHVFVKIEKRGLTTQHAVDRIAKALGVSARDIGVAGMKDRHAVTRQWLSLPPPTTPEAVRALMLDDVAIVEVARHPHKLRTGHVRANRFILCVRGVVDDALPRASAILERLARAPGAPNWYGEQRFGRDGDNAERGLAIVNGGKPPRDRKLARLLVSSLQSKLFNDWLIARMRDDLYARVIAGDVLHKVRRLIDARRELASDAGTVAGPRPADKVRRLIDARRELASDAGTVAGPRPADKSGGGLFNCEEPAVDEPRLLASEVVVTGPMFGDRMRRSSDGTPAAEREAATLQAAGLLPDSFATVRSIAEGTRRDASISIGEPTVRLIEPGVLEVAFSLPGGAYATVVMRELMKSS